MRALPFLIAAIACTGEVVPDPTDTDAPVVGFRVQGTLDEVLMPLRPDSEGLCASLLGPDEAVLDTVAIEDGAWAFDEVTERPESGLLLSVDDCDAGDAVPLPTVTGLAPERYRELPDGETVHTVAYVVLSASLDELAAGVEGLEQGGFVVGLARTDDAIPDPIGGVTVDCPACAVAADPRYLDADPEGGRFGDADGPNTATDDALGAFLLPDAEVGAYHAVHLGGEYDFGDVTTGGLAARIVVVTFVAGADDTTPFMPGPPGPLP